MEYRLLEIAGGGDTETVIDGDDTVDAVVIRPAYTVERDALLEDSLY